jgi:hypothetical protein
MADRRAIYKKFSGYQRRSTQHLRFNQFMFKRDAKLNVVLWLGTSGVGILIALLLPSAARNQGAYTWGALFFYVVGFAAFASAKVSQFKKGITISFGSRGLIGWQRWAYHGGYTLMGAGVLATIVL